MFWTRFLHPITITDPSTQHHTTVRYSTLQHCSKHQHKSWCEDHQEDHYSLLSLPYWHLTCCDIYLGLLLSWWWPSCSSRFCFQLCSMSDNNPALRSLEMGSPDITTPWDLAPAVTTDHKISLQHSTHCPHIFLLSRCHLHLWLVRIWSGYLLSSCHPP